MKRILISVVGAAAGSLAGLAVAALGAGNPAMIAGGLAGMILPHLVLGPPSR